MALPAGDHRPTAPGEAGAPDATPSSEVVPRSAGRDRAPSAAGWRALGQRRRHGDAEVVVERLVPTSAPGGAGQAFALPPPIAVRALLDRVPPRVRWTITAAAGAGVLALSLPTVLRGPRPPVEERLPRADAAAPASPTGPGSRPGRDTVASRDVTAGRTAVVVAVVGAVGGVDPATSTTSGSTVPARLLVHVAGAVVRPGVVEVKGTARVADAVAAAGGVAPDADADLVNLAAPLHDGDRIYVPRVPSPTRVAPATAAPAAALAAGDDPVATLVMPAALVPSASRVGVVAAPDPSAAAPGGSGGAPPAARVDLNAASVTELETLPGIGPAMAQRIVDHRSAHGRFRSIDQLTDVTGIGPAKLAALRDRVRV